MAEELGIGRQIICHPGSLMPKYPLFHAADGFLFASKIGDTGNCPLEAMAAGCPVVAVRASGVVDVVRQGKERLHDRRE